MIFWRRAQRLVQLVGEVVRVVVEDADPVDPLDLVELAEQLGQPGPAVEVDAVIGHVLGDEDQLADAVGGQLAGLLDDLLDRLGDVLAAHVGDRAEGAEPVAAFGDLQVGEVPGRDPQPGAVVLGLDRGGAEDGALLVQAAHDPVGDPGDLLAAEDADDLVDLGHLFEQHLLLPLGQAAGDDHALDLARPASARASRGSRRSDSCRAASMNPQVLTIDQVGLLGVGHERVAVLRQQAEHPLGIDEVLRDSRG